ncbi:MAG: carbohydrate ABC transporter permease [Caldilinea sp.]|nr:carbohydrate ABC transporter permease [Caldilinea sp.]
MTTTPIENSHAQKASSGGAGDFLFALLRNGFAIFLLIVILFPFYYMFITSLKTVAETRAYPPSLYPMNSVGLQNYFEVVTRIDFFAYLRNSVTVSVVVTVGALFTSSLAGYIFAKFDFRGRPLFLIVRAMGIYDSHWALIIPGLVTAWGIFLMRQNKKSIPTEMLDAARIDGASEMAIFLRIVLPISKPALAALGVFIFMHYWNDFLWPLIVIEDAPKRTLPLGLALFSEGFGIARWNIVMAATVMTVLPILIVFALAQRSFIEGITLGSVKG